MTVKVSNRAREYVLSRAGWGEHSTEAGQTTIELFAMGASIVVLSVSKLVRTVQSWPEGPAVRTGQGPRRRQAQLIGPNYAHRHEEVTLSLSLANQTTRATVVLAANNSGHGDEDNLKLVPIALGLR